MPVPQVVQPLRPLPLRELLQPQELQPQELQPQPLRELPQPQELPLSKESKPQPQPLLELLQPLQELQLKHIINFTLSLEFLRQRFSPLPLYFILCGKNYLRAKLFLNLYFYV